MYVAFSFHMLNNTDNNTKSSSHPDFEFAYQESGSGIAGPRRLEISYHSGTNKLEVTDKLAHSPILQKYLLDSEKNHLKDLIVKNEFFTTKDSYLPSSLNLQRCLDCLYYSLDIKINEQIHSVKWRSDSNIPDGLLKISDAIKNISK